MTDDKPVPVEQDPETDLSTEVRDLVGRVDDPARLLECYYWSHEPGMLECIRAVLAMPAQARGALQAFLAAAVARDDITATIDSAGTLMLHSPEAASILSTFFSRESTGMPARHRH